MAHAFIEGSNTDMTATDTQKNTVLISNPRELCLRVALRVCRAIKCGIISKLYRTAFEVCSLQYSGLLHCKEVQPTLHTRRVCNRIGSPLCRDVP